MGLAGIYFIVTGIQYWMPSYMDQVLGAPKDTVTSYFTIITLSGPIGGVITGGIVTQNYGGYNTEKG